MPLRTLTNTLKGVYSYILLYNSIDIDFRTTLTQFRATEVDDGGLKKKSTCHKYLRVTVISLLVMAVTLLSVCTCKCIVIELMHVIVQFT